MLSKRTIAHILALALLTTPLAAEAQEKGEVPRIRYLGGSPFLGGGSAYGYHLLVAFEKGLRELGYVDGRNIRFVTGTASGSYGEAVAKTVHAGYDIIVVVGDEWARAAAQATKTIPIVFAGVGDPVGAGLVATLARPGGNVTGVADLATELSRKRLELLREVVPGLSRVAVLRNPDNAGSLLALRQTEFAARQLDLQLHVFEVRSPDEFDHAASEMSKAHVGALIVLPDRVFFQNQGQLTTLTKQTRLPTIFDQREYVNAAGQMSYGASPRHLYRRAARYVDKILKGAKPADLPVEQPTKFELVINLKTAKALGLTIPRSVLVRANELIE